MSDAPGIPAHVKALWDRMRMRAGVLVRQRRAGRAVETAPVGSAARGRVLVIDQQVPRNDRNAGDRNITDFMRTLVETGWGVSYFPHQPAADPGYAAPLRALGVDLIAGPRRPSLAVWLRAHRGGLHHVMLCRPHLAATYLPTVRRHASVPVTYYGHDLHHARMRMEARLRDDAALLASAERMEAQERWVWRRSDAVIYPTQEEVDAIDASCPGVKAQAVPIFRFDQVTARTQHPVGANVVFVGGFGHPPNVDAATWLARDIWPHVLMRRPDARLSVVGANPPDDVAALASDSVTVTGAISHDELTHLYDGARVAAVPLRSGAGMKLKVVEALALGTPVVMTSVGAQGFDELVDAFSPPQDDPLSFAEAIVTWLDLPADDWLALSHRQADYAATRFDAAAMRAGLESAFAAAERRRGSG